MAQHRDPLDRLVLRRGDVAMRLGPVGNQPPACAGILVVVLHRARGAEADWTHVYRLDARCARTVHLERAMPGDRRFELARWAKATFAVSREPVPQDAPALHRVA